MATFNVDTRNSLSWTTWGVQKLMKSVGTETLLHGPKFLRSKEVVKKTQPLGSPELEVPTTRMFGCTVSHRMVHDFHVYDIKPKTTTAGKKRKFIYFAGGGFQDVASAGHWAFVAEMTNGIPNCSSIMVSYPLSPTNTADKVYHLIQKVYLALLAEAADQGEEAIVAGDSAGGNLSLGLPLSTLAADSKALAPATILAICPAVEASHSNPDILKVEPFDPMLTKAYCDDASKKWRGPWPTEDPRMSPLFADVSLLVTHGIYLVGVIGRYDVLSPDELILLEKTRKAGVHADWLVWDKQMHCFPIASSMGLPESVEGARWIIEKLSK